MKQHPKRRFPYPTEIDIILKNVTKSNKMFLLLTQKQSLSLDFQQRCRAYLKQKSHLLTDQSAQVSFQNLRVRFSREETANYI